MLKKTDFPQIRRQRLEVLQVNLGYYCNQSCLHCHVNAGPKRKEMMDAKTAGQIIAFLEHSDVHTLDLTGGAPELHEQFRPLVEAGRRAGCRIIDRCNLTVLFEPGQENLADYLAGSGVDVVASLPCYLEDNVNAQRGDGVYEKSIQGLRRLNALGYGIEGSGLNLELVYNPQGPVLPPPQAQLELDYKRYLAEKYGVHFNRLLALANLPIQRFGSTLISKGQFHAYMALLRDSHNEGNLASVMCRNTLSVDYRGYVYDCDFNQMLNMPAGGKGPRHISELNADPIAGESIAIADHCYGCTAGQGSSCGGALG
ncbi:MAG: arsenosugar biosynthesis radical SAM protein ArsS [Leptospiraceae bacterium]|nr:arsenosugar biosynthesis radical SAM protein ArsS [Leptospiraceae bacterium]